MSTSLGGARNKSVPPRDSNVNARSREPRYVDLSKARAEDRRMEDITRRREERRRKMYGVPEGSEAIYQISEARRVKHTNSMSGKPQDQYIYEKHRRAQLAEAAGKPARTPIMERSEFKKERNPGKVALSIGIAALLVAVVVCCIIVFLRAQDIYTDGNVKISADRIIELSGIKKGDHVFVIDKSEAKIGIESDPYLVFKDVKYKFPQTVTICVEERAAMAAIPVGDMYAVIDKEGVVLDIPLEAPNKPAVKGITLSQYQKGYRMRSDDSYKQMTLTDILTAMNAAEMNVDIAEIDVRDVNHITMTTPEGMRIVIGQNERMDDKMRWINTVIPELEKEGITTGSLDVTVEGSAAYSPDSEEGENENPAAPEPTKDLSLIYPDGTIVDPGTAPEPEPGPSATPVPEEGDDSVQE